MLYKVKVETELMVVAGSPKDAVDIAKKNAPNEIIAYGKGIATAITNVNDIPNDWKDVIPYAPEGTQETKKCSELVPVSPLHRVGLAEEEMNHIIKIQETKKDESKVSEVKPETRTDPIPPKLDWHETKTGQAMPRLRFVR